MPGSRHGWMVLTDVNGEVHEVLNQARTAAYLANKAITPNGINICDITDFGGCENYAMVPYCVGATKGSVDFPGTNSNYLSTPDAPALRPSGDITYVFKLAADNWNDTGLRTVVSKWVPGLLVYQVGSATQTYFLVYVYDSAGVQQGWGTTSPTSASMGLVNGEFTWFALALDMDNGAGGKAVRMSTSRDGVTWTDRGVSTAAGVVTTPLTHSAADLVIGAVTGTNSYNGKIGYVSISNGISGTATPGGAEVFRMDPSNIPTDNNAATQTFTASTGQTVTVNRSGSPATLLTAEVAAYETWGQLTFDTPASDQAPWYNEDYPESADALGFVVEEWTGLDDQHVSRAMTRTGRDRGGATPGTIGNRERVMKLNVLLFANSEAGMMYLFRWFAALLESVCSSCESNTMLIRDHCGDPDDPTDGLRELRDIVLIEGLGWEAKVGRRDSCYVRRASFTLAAGDPCMYLPEVTPVVTASTVSLGPGLLSTTYSPTRSPARPSCSELPATTRKSYSWAAQSAMGAKAPIVTFYNNNVEHAFPFRAILYQDTYGIGATPNPCGLARIGEIYVRPMPPYSSVRWDVTGRQIMYSDPTTGGWVESWFLIGSNDDEIQRYFTLPCGGDHHMILEPGTLAIGRVGTTGNVFEYNGIIFSNPHYPDVTVLVGERVSCR